MSYYSVTLEPSNDQLGTVEMVTANVACVLAGVREILAGMVESGGPEIGDKANAAAELLDLQNHLLCEVSGMVYRIRQQRDAIAEIMHEPKGEGA